MDMEKLKVYYGWSKINAVRKKRSLSVMFEMTSHVAGTEDSACCLQLRIRCL